MEKETMSERFDERFPVPDGHKFIGVERISDLKSFLQQEIYRAVAEREEEIVEGLKTFADELPDELQVTGCGNLQRVSIFIKRDILSLIIKNK